MDERPLRENWASHTGFILAAAGSAIGLGNLWKFPYMAYKNEGGSFVLVYLASVVLVGLPIMMAEIVIGRRSQRRTQHAKHGGRIVRVGDGAQQRVKLLTFRMVQWVMPPVDGEGNPPVTQRADIERRLGHGAEKNGDVTEFESSSPMLPREPARDRFPLRCPCLLDPLPRVF